MPPIARCRVLIFDQPGHFVFPRGSRGINSIEKISWERALAILLLLRTFRSRYRIMLFDRRLHLLPQRLCIASASEDHMVVINEEIEKLEQNERPHGELTKHALHAPAVDIQMHAQYVFQRIWLPWQYLHQIFLLAMPLQLI